MWSELRAPSMTHELTSKVAHVRHLKKLLDAMYDEDAIRKYYEYQDVRHVQLSLTAEGTRISYDDTMAIYNHCMVLGVNYNTFIECNNLSTALNKVKEYVSKELPLNESRLGELHATLGHSLLTDTNCGKYKKVKNEIGRGMYTTAQINQVPKLMRELFKLSKEIDEPLIRAPWFSYNLLSIHPFVDFNGRLSRLCEAYILLEAGLPMISLEEVEVSTYMGLLRNGQENGDRINLDYINFFLDKVILQMKNMME